MNNHLKKSLRLTRTEVNILWLKTSLQWTRKEVYILQVKNHEMDSHRGKYSTLLFYKNMSYKIMRLGLSKKEHF